MNNDLEEEDGRNLQPGFEHPPAAIEQIRSFRQDIEALQREKDDIEKRLNDQIRILDANYRDEKEQREAFERKLKQSEETASKEKKEKIELQIKLKNEEEDKKIVQQKLNDFKQVSYEKEQKAESQLNEKEKERRKTQYALKYEQEEKKEAIDRSNEFEKNYQQEVIRRKNVEVERDKLSKENDKFKREIERLNKQIENQQNLVSEYEIKYQTEVEAKERMKKDSDYKFEQLRKDSEERIENEQKNSQNEIQRRIQLENDIKNQIKLQENALLRVQKTENDNSELEAKIIEMQNEVKILKEDINKENQKSEKEIQKSAEEERKRKEIEDQKQNIENQNQIIKRENEKIKIENIRIKKKFGEEIVENEIQLIEVKEKEKEDQIQELKVQIKWMKLPDDLLKKLGEDLKKPLQGTEIQKKKALQLLENNCKFLSLALNDRKDDDGRKRVIQSGVIEGFINVFENYDLNLITRTYSQVFFQFTNPSSDEVCLLLAKKKPYPGLIRLLEHTIDDVAGDAIASIFNIQLSGSNTTPESDPHPHYETIQESDGIKNIFALFQMKGSKQNRDISALCIGFLFRAREISDQVMRQEIIGHLKSLLNDSDAWLKGSAKDALKYLAQNKKNKVAIEAGGFSIPK